MCMWYGVMILNFTMFSTHTHSIYIFSLFSYSYSKRGRFVVVVHSPSSFRSFFLCDYVLRNHIQWCFNTWWVFCSSTIYNKIQYNRCLLCVFFSSLIHFVHACRPLMRTNGTFKTCSYFAITFFF